MGKRIILVFITLAFVTVHTGAWRNGRLFQYKQLDSIHSGGLRIVSYSSGMSRYIPHIIRQYEAARTAHERIWNIDKPLQPAFLFLSDLQDDGNGGASPLPYNYIGIGMAPVNMSYYIMPTTERYSHLFRHEYTHIVTTDRPNRRDRAMRSFFGAKVVADNRYPLSMLWSYLTVPRWYAPRWYQEGMACFMETWMSGGVGRAMGGYDEMYFRSLVNDSARMSSVVGLESEGTTKDFQTGANAYLYGTRFVNYLVMKYGLDRVLQFYNRTEGDKAFFASQFKKVFGSTLSVVWRQWQEYEKIHQHTNIDNIARYPTTVTMPVTDCTLGSASPLVVDDSLNVAYAAVNSPGDYAHLERIDLKTGARERICSIDGPMLYQTAYVAYDARRQRLFWTDRNAAWRGLRWKTMDKRRSNTTVGEGKMKLQRVSNIVYDNANDCLYGLCSHEGVTHIVRYNAEMTQRDVLYSFRFGVSVTDLDVSHDGRLLAMTVVGEKGDNTLMVFDVNSLENAVYSPRKLWTMQDSNLSQFRFSRDDSRLIGTSYYTGVSNVWAVDIAEGSRHLLSNTTTGLFAPVEGADDSIYALQFRHDGFVPVRFAGKEITDCNAIEFLGQKVCDARHEVTTLADVANDARHYPFSEIYDSLKAYSPFHETAFQGAYPDISGFTDASAWNHVTPVLGYRMLFSDLLGQNVVELSFGISPWSGNAWKNRFHASAEWKVNRVKMEMSWNKTDFYDLFGPIRNSRKGYSIGAEYRDEHNMLLPFKWHWGMAAYMYGDMDALPLYQNVSVENGVRSFQTFSAEIGLSKTRTSLGGIMPEQGYELLCSGYAYHADGLFFPSLTASLAEGVLMPFMRNTSGWLYLSAGQHFGNGTTVFSNEYFGGFRNNRVDHGGIYRYRTVNAMPGTDIDAISARSFMKVTGELNLMPVRFYNTGMLGLYPTYAQLSLFATDLMANPWGRERFANHVSIGAQLNMEVVMFNYFNATLSVGYAKGIGHPMGGKRKANGEWLVTLKLL